MVHYIALYKLKPNTTDDVIEKIIRESRSCFHRVSEAHNFRSGRSIRSDNPFSFFLSADFDNLEKLKMFQDDPVSSKLTPPSAVSFSMKPNRGKTLNFHKINIFRKITDKL
jgi:Stress responsive A/B Barrel Domain